MLILIVSVFLRIFWNAPASRCPSSSLCQSGVTRRPLPWHGWRPAASAGTRWSWLLSSTSTAAARSTSAKGQTFVGLFPCSWFLVPCSLHKSYQKQSPPVLWSLKEVHSEMKICWRCAHPQAIQDVGEFVSSLDLEKLSITSLAHQWILSSEWVPSEWESKLIKLSWLKLHNNPHHSSPSVNVLFIRNKYIKAFLTLNLC